MAREIFEIKVLFNGNNINVKCNKSIKKYYTIINQNNKNKY